MANPEKKPDNILAAQEEEPELVSPEVQVELDKRHCWNDSPQRERNGQALKMRLVIVRRHHAIVLAVERNKYVTDGRHGFGGSPADRSEIATRRRAAECDYEFSLIEYGIPRPGARTLCSAAKSL